MSNDTFTQYEQLQALKLSEGAKLKAEIEGYQREHKRILRLILKRRKDKYE